MLVNPNIIEELQNDAKETRTQKAKVYAKLGKVNIVNVEYEDLNNFEINAQVYGSEDYSTYISVKKGEIEDISCECQDYYNYYGVCKHTLATVMAFDEDEKYANKLGKKIAKTVVSNTDKQKYRNFKQILNTFYNEEVEEISGIEDEEQNLKGVGTIVLEPKITYDKFLGDMRLELKIGNKRMYKIKNLAEFYNNMLEKQYYKYGEKLAFIHTEEMFEESSKKLLEFVLKYAEIIKYANSNSNSNYRYYGKALNESSIVVSNSGLDDLFESLKGKKVQFQKDFITGIVEFVEENPEIYFRLRKISEQEYQILPNIEIYKVTIIKGKKYKYILGENKLYRCSKDFEKTVLKLLETFRQNYLQDVLLSKEDLRGLFSVIMPRVKNTIVLENIPLEEIEEYRPKNLGVKVYLDFDKNNYLTAAVKFCYENDEFNPLDESKQIKIPRNMVEETRALNIFKRSGFMLDVNNKSFILPEEEKIYEFLTEDINLYMQKFEVLVTDNFKTKQVTKPQLGTLGIKVENNLLSINLENLQLDIEELEQVMEKYTLKKKFHRLKDGSFINLEDNKEIDFTNKLITGMNIDYKDLKEGEIKLPVYRSLYLEQLLKQIKGTQVTKNESYKEIVGELDKQNIEENVKVPDELDNVLRYYQKIGYKWLKTLDYYNFGGVLADDMGLGKTIQILSIIQNYVKSTFENRKASIVISPSSLCLNWQNEVEKFANTINTLVIKGTASERKKQISEIEKYDLVIISYDLLKRDIELFKEKNYEFRYIIADEAQYLKNSNTQNAKSIKEIKAVTRFALTGTPIENSLAELWSIFDYIMPGYLFTYKKFKELYEIPIVKDNDEQAMQKLRMLIEPFVLRRTKKEVLTELPEKTITVLNNEMQEEQNNIYISYLAKVKEEVANVINERGFQKSQIQILSALTRLRQICCHPSLFIENYEGESSKLEQCMEVIEDATNGGHKILLFSTYTSMFPIIENQLKEKDIKYFKLTGSTKIDERIKLVDEFNENKEIKVFLISLKAGGTGLNLTGADMVIHYDPWWNISAENQATDRAYRIGQKNNVQVYKLITKNSIEEKIYELQQKKSELIDNVLTTRTRFISKLSKEEIMSLFE